jgi:MULE transposase domain
LINTKTHRQKIIPYSASRRVLEDEEYGLMITAKEYYNQVRKQLADKRKPKTIEGILVALQEAGFVYRSRVDIEEDGSGTIISKTLVQIFFAHRKQLEAAKRFVSGFLLVIDGTFNTNDLRFPLLVIVGVLNTGRTFPVAFSFCPSESREAFDFVWESLKEECFIPEIAPPRVILGDWAPGLVSSVPGAFPDTQLQGCDWHAVQAMVKWFRLHGYVSTEIDGYVTEDTPPVYIDGLERMAWGYIKSMTIEELDSNRAYLAENLKPEHKYYILKHWQELETRVVHYYTKIYPNLGSTSSQRVESYHDSVREMTNGQLSLEAATKRLISKVLSILKEIEIDEERSLRGYPRLLQADSRAFTNLKCTITIYAAQMIEPQWKELRQALTANESIEDSPYRCQILLRFGLPCKHVLKRAFDTGEPIPRSLIHPRYWLQGPTIHAREWQPRYAEDARVDYMSEQHWKSSDKTEELARLRDAMKPEERSRYDAQIARVQDNLISIGKNVLIEQDIPVGMPDPALKDKGRKVKPHSTSNRLETGPETAKRLQLAQEKALRRVTREAAEAAEVIRQARQTDEQREAEKQSAQDGTAGEFDEDEEGEEDDEDDETNKAGLERPGTPPQRKRTHTLVSRTPTKPATPPRPPPPRASTPIEEDLYELPISTAPARLTPGGRPQRERVPTERAKIARRAGWLPEEQARE